MIAVNICNKMAVILIGLPGSGKSTFAEKYLTMCKVFSTDKYREKFTGSVEDQSQNKRVFKTIYEDMQSALEQGLNIAFDATNVTKKERAEFIEMVRPYEYNIIGIVFHTNPDICAKRVEQRGWNVDSNALINKFQRRYVEPTLVEGFNTLINGDK